MAGIVYLRTDRFEVKLEGIAFKTRDFESLCSVDFLFPDGKTWSRAPVIGVDVMRHPRDPNNILLLLCFGVGCAILKFNSGDELPESILTFLKDERIRFAGFGIPEKKDLLPFEKLGMRKEKVDIGYMAARILDDHKYKKCELAQLARKILRVKSMIGLTQSSSSQRHEQIKCAICQLFITTAIAMALLGKGDRRRSGSSHSTPSPSRSLSFLKNLNQLPLLTEGWFKFSKNKKIHSEKIHDKPVATTIIDGFSGKGIANDSHFGVHVDDDDDGFGDDDPFYGKTVGGTPCGGGDDPFYGKTVNGIRCGGDDPFYGKTVSIPYDAGDDEDEDDDHHRFHAKGKKGFFDDAVKYFKNKDGENTPPRKEACNATPVKQPLKGILKSASIRIHECPNLTTSRPESAPVTPEASSSDEAAMAKKVLRRANSKGFNVSFKEARFSA